MYHPSTQTSAKYVGEPNGVSGSWFHSVLAIDISATAGVNQQMEYDTLFLFLSVTLTFKQIIYKNKLPYTLKAVILIHLFTHPNIRWNQSGSPV